jgi:hypothetical protein
MWLVGKELWSAVYRQDRTIFEQGDTNMLVEAYVPLTFQSFICVTYTSNSWHHVLKLKHPQGKRGRRVDNLIHTLINVAIPHYIAGHRTQEFGFQGPDLEVRERVKIKSKAELIPPEDIKEIEAGNIFEVRSQSDRTRYYTVNIDENTCSPCPSFPKILFCKHICAVQNNYPDVAEHHFFRPEPEATSSSRSSPAPPVVDSADASTSSAPTSALYVCQDRLLLDFILHKLQHLQQSKVVPSAALTESLHTLNTSLSRLAFPNINRTTRANRNSSWARGMNKSSAEMIWRFNSANTPSCAAPHFHPP